MADDDLTPLEGLEGLSKEEIDSLNANPDPPKDDLGDAGKKALEAERKARRDAEKALKAAQAEAEKYKTASLSDQEKAIKDAETKAREESLGKAKTRVLEEAVTAAAARKLKHPEDAARFLTMSDFEVDDDLKIDKTAIESAIDELVKSRPELAAEAPTPGDADQGKRGNRPKQLSRADLKTMTDDQINEAREKGQLEDLMAGKS